MTSSRSKMISSSVILIALMVYIYSVYYTSNEGKYVDIPGEQESSRNSSTTTSSTFLPTTMHQKNTDEKSILNIHMVPHRSVDDN